MAEWIEVLVRKIRYAGSTPVGDSKKNVPVVKWFNTLVCKTNIQRFESVRGLKIKFIEIYLVVNQLALGCRIWNADNVGSSPIY